MYENEFETKEKKIETKEKIEPQHIHLAPVPRKPQVKFNPGLSQIFSMVFLSIITCPLSFQNTGHVFTAVLQDLVMITESVTLSNTYKGKIQNGTKFLVLD